MLKLFKDKSSVVIMHEYIGSVSDENPEVVIKGKILSI